jgi:hypothetical protein
MNFEIFQAMSICKLLPMKKVFNIYNKLQFKKKNLPPNLFISQISLVV